MEPSDVKEMAKKFGPPFGLFVMLSLPVVFEPSQVWYDWPVFGEFQLTNSLKCLLIALIWCLVFLGWYLWKKVNPSYREHVYEDVRALRKFLLEDLQLHYDYDGWRECVERLRPFQVSVPKGKDRDKYYEILDASKRCLQFHISKRLQEPTESMVNDYMSEIDSFPEKIKRFVDQTEWANG